MELQNGKRNGKAKTRVEMTDMLTKTEVDNGEVNYEIGVSLSARNEDNMGENEAMLPAMKPPDYFQVRLYSKC